MLKLITIAVLFGFFLAVAWSLLLVDKSPSKAKLEQLYCNVHGKMDLAAVAFWIGLGTTVLCVVYFLFKEKVPEGFIALYGIFVGQVMAPISLKVIFKGKEPPTLPELPK